MTVDHPHDGPGPEDRDDAMIRRLEAEAPAELATGRSIAPAVQRRIETSTSQSVYRLLVPVAVAASLVLVAGIAWQAGRSAGSGSMSADPLLGGPATVITDGAGGIPGTRRGSNVGRDVGRVLVRLTETAQAPLRREAEATREIGGGLARLFTREVSDKIRLLRPRPRPDEGGASL